VYSSKDLTLNGIFMFNSQLFLCFRMGPFPIHLPTEENMAGLRKIQENFPHLYLMKEPS